MIGDYKELIDLSIFYLKGKPDDTFRFKSAGPIHKARWMGKLLYCIKLNLCENKKESSTRHVLSIATLNRPQKLNILCIL